MGGERADREMRVKIAKMGEKSIQIAMISVLAMRIMCTAIKEQTRTYMYVRSRMAVFGAFTHSRIILDHRPVIIRVVSGIIRVVSGITV